MKTVKKEQLRIVGVAVRTENAPTKAEHDIPALWGRFMETNISAQLNGKSSDEIYCVYCEYDGDHTKPYTVLIGFSVPAETVIPDGLKAIEIESSNYSVFKAEGDLTGSAVFNTWNEIWNSEIQRSYQADFEIYGKDAMNPKDGKIDIFVGVNN